VTAGPAHSGVPVTCDNPHLCDDVEGLPRIARCDVERRLPTFVATSDDGEVARESIDDDGDVLVWPESRLGTSAIWTGTLR
jgi:hypothetical protein